MNIGPPSIWLPYCGPAPAPAEWTSYWNFDPVLLSVLGVSAFLAWRLADESNGRRLLGGAVALSLLLFVSPFCALSSALFSVRVTHHVLIAAVLAPLIIFAMPEHRTRLRGSLTFWTAAQTLIFWVWHAPGLYAEALSSDIVYWVMQLSLLGTAAGFWAALRRAQEPAAIAALLFSTVQMGLLGALILFSPTALYAPHYLTTASWGLSVLDDQQLAGLIMWVPSAGLYLGSAIYIVSRWFAREHNAVTP
ncbi:cytochrome c oxidase assembly protein [Sphingorhabdus sp.]|uniref:cytochrome c oxidase assembly protein n=1 Tax=Sphingorhabdus sp. TaxID=1902408 RepID=UPI00391A55E8